MIVMGGSTSGVMRRDVWRWTRSPGSTDLDLFKNYVVTGLTPKGCTDVPVNNTVVCRSTEGPVGRKYALDPQHAHSDSVSVEIFLPVTTDVFHLKLVFGASEDLGKGCSLFLKGQPSGVVSVEGTCVSAAVTTPVKIDKNDMLRSGQWNIITWSFDWNQPIPIARLYFPRGDLLQATVPLDPALASARYKDGFNVGHGLQFIKVVSYQEPWTTDTGRGFTYRRIAVSVPSGNWEQLTPLAPFEGRTQASAVGLRDGGFLVMGGQGLRDRLNDVWRWFPKQCGSADLQLNCPSDQSEPPPNCVDSAQGQWVRLFEKAPWTVRSGMGATALLNGDVLITGGFDGEFQNDVWRWRYTHGAGVCSPEWVGEWTRVASPPSATWDARYGHSVLAMGSLLGKDAVLLFGGFGRVSKSDSTLLVGRSVSVQMSGSNTMFSDLWCWEDGEWIELINSSPMTKRFHSSVVSRGNSSFAMIGGFDVNVRPTVDVWKWTAEPQVNPVTGDRKLCYVEALNV